MIEKFRNFWREGLPVELGQPRTDHLVLRAITPEECEGSVSLVGGAELHTVYEVVSVGPAVREIAPRDLVLPVFEALRAAGSHLICREDEIVLRWERSALIAPAEQVAA